MQLTRDQRLHNVGSGMVNQLIGLCEQFRSILKDGVKNPAGTAGLKAEFNATGEEIRAALGDNEWQLDTVLEFVLDGKSNQIVKAVKAAASNGSEQKTPIQHPRATKTRTRSVR